MSFDQGQFDFDAKGIDAGWRNWREEMDARKRAFEARWGVVLGARVTVCLREYDKPFTGILEWLNPDQNEMNRPPRFRLRGLEFGHEEIESLVKTDD